MVGILTRKESGHPLRQSASPTPAFGLAFFLYSLMVQNETVCLIWCNQIRGMWDSQRLLGSFENIGVYWYFVSPNLIRSVSLLIVSESWYSPSGESSLHQCFYWVKMSLPILSDSRHVRQSATLSRVIFNNFAGYPLNYRAYGQYPDNGWAYT